MAKRIKGHIDLFVDDGKIVDHNRKEYTEAEAKAAWLAGVVDDYNLSFQRFAQRCSFSLAELADYYRREDAARNQQPGVGPGIAVEPTGFAIGE